jgi:3-oxoacyl-[acyl-carrier protein] reductase
MNLQLQDRVALVTGASEGIGAGMVRVFAAQGVTVVATARREDRLLALADEIAKSGGIRPYVIAADITDGRSTRQPACSGAATLRHDRHCD